MATEICPALSQSSEMGVNVKNGALVDASNRIQFDWSYALAVTSYKIYRAIDPFRTFALQTTTASNSWVETVQSPIYFYSVTAVMP